MLNVIEELERSRDALRERLAELHMSFKDCERIALRKIEAAEQAAKDLRERLEVVEKQNREWEADDKGYAGLWKEAREKYLLLTAQHSRLCDLVYEADGETLKQDALRDRLEGAEQDRDEWRESVAGCGAELEGANNHIVQLQDDLIAACQRVEAAEQDLRLNAAMLARQTDLARDAEQARAHAEAGRIHTDEALAVWVERCRLAEQARDRAEADARRYRALRDRKSVMTPFISDPLNGAVTYTPEGLDAAIDALASEEPK